MKKTLIYSICAMIALLAQTGCSSSDDGDNYLFATELLRVTDQLNILDNSAILHIEANCDWRIEGIPDWLNVDMSSGNANQTVTMTCDDNESANTARVATLTVKVVSGKVQRTVTVTQAPGRLRFTLSTNLLSFTSEGGTMALGIDANIEWQIEGAADWFSLDKTSGTSADHSVNITCQPSLLEIKREATILVKAGALSQSVIISQLGLAKMLSVTPTSINAAAIGETYPISVSGDATWTASSTTPWAKLDRLSGVGDATLELTVEDNTTIEERQAIITFYSGAGEYTCTVRQAAGRLPVLSDINITDVSKYSFSAVSSFTSEFPVTEFGFCYSVTNPEPNTSDTKLPLTAHTDGVIKVDVSGLESGRTYYIRTYAVSAAGTGYSSVVTVTTSGQIPGPNDNPIPY